MLCLGFGSRQVKIALPRSSVTFMFIPVWVVRIGDRFIHPHCSVWLCVWFSSVLNLKTIRMQLRGSLRVLLFVSLAQPSFCHGAQLFLHLHLAWHIWLPPALLIAFVAARCCQVSISRLPAGRVTGVHQAAGRWMKHFKCYTTGGLEIGCLVCFWFTVELLLWLSRCHLPSVAMEDSRHLISLKLGKVFCSPAARGVLKAMGGVEGHAVSPWKLQDWLTLRNGIQSSTWCLLQWVGVWLFTARVTWAILKLAFLSHLIPELLVTCRWGVGH